MTILPASIPSQRVRPIRAETRATLVTSIARARRWLNELLADPTATVERIAEREGCSTRKVNLTISLAFISSDLVKAAIDGRLPHRMGVRACATCLPNGLSNTSCLGLPRRSSSGRVLGLSAP
jgi:hypothetical protein